MEAQLAGLDDLIVGTLLSTVGILALLLSAFRSERGNALLAAFGAFTLLFGVRLTFASPLLVAFGASAAATAWVRDTITYVINIPAWYFFLKFLGRERETLLRRWLAIVCTFGAVGILSDIVRMDSGTLAHRPNNVLVVTGIVILATLSISEYRRRPTPDVKILILGVAILGVFSLNANLVGMGVLPWTYEDEALGMLTFVGCLGFIAAKRSFQAERELAAIEKELDTARQVQQSLLPESVPSLPGLEVAVRFQPSSAVAGDLYDFLPGRRGALGLFIADVSGHGVPAAIIASMVKIAVDSQSDSFDSPAALLTRVNQALCGNLRRGFVTATYAWVDVDCCALVVANAGHPPPLYLACNTEAVREIGGQGPVLGRFPTAEFSEEHLQLGEGDRLVLFTDGLIEARNPQGEMFGDHGLRSLLAASRSTPCESSSDSLLAALQRHTGGSRLELDDDLTLLVVDWSP